MRDRGNPILVIAGTIITVVLLGIHTAISMEIGEAYAIPTTILGLISAGVVLRGPVGQALGKRISGESAGGELPPEAVLQELDELRGRLAELEERADFSERLLAQQRDGQPG